MAKKRIIITAFLVLTLAVLSCILIYEDKNLEVNHFEIYSEDLPSEFEDFRIVHISDLHNAVFGKDNEKLIGMLREAEPDIIAITGDIIDSRRTDIDISSDFVKQAVEIAPCYYVTGNHEARIGEEYSALKKNMQQAGVIILDNKIAFVEHSGALIEVIGLEDPTFSVIGSTDDEAKVVADSLSNLMSEGKKFTVLLSHKPEFFDLYVENKVDLVLSGHTHAGQFVLPFVGGLVAPGQGFFPEYDSGLFENNGTNMVVSRGIGNSIIPLRINNRPEIVLIELHRA